MGRGSVRRGIKDAYSFTVGICEDVECHALHFLLQDKDGDVFADMTIGVEHVPALIEKMRELAYEIEVMKKDY